MRIACLADTHCTVPEIESNSLFPRQIAALPKEKAEDLYNKMREEIQLAYSTCLDWLRRNSSWDLLVHLGDITGGYKEQGCHYPSAREIVSRVEKDLRDLAPKFRVVLGDHDLGYSHKGSLPGSGINAESIAFCRETFGEFFWTEENDGVLSIGICSPIAEYSGSDAKIAQLKREQAEFVGDMLLSHEGAWMLYTHRPLAVNYLAKQIEGRRKQLLKMVWGHNHDPRKATLLRAILLGTTTNKVVRECLKKSVCCPSTAPLWWHGYGLLTLEQKQEKIRARTVILDRPSDSRNLPTSSFWKCLWWMIKMRKKR